MSAANGSTAGLPTAAAMSAAASRVRTGSRPVMATRAPSAARPAAVALPIPLVPPVTSTVLPAIGPVPLFVIADSSPRRQPLATWAVVACEVATEQIASVVTAVGCAHDGVHVERLGLVVVQENALVAVVLDEHDRTVDPVVEGVTAAGAADPRDV